jgi:methionyl-tRNA formyltransferase
MRIVFVGTSELGIPSLNALVEQGRHAVVVITKPDMVGGRGRKVIESPVKREAVRLGLEVRQPEKINADETIRWMKDQGTDVMVVASFWAKLSDTLLEAPRFGGINIHPSLLPRYRGAAPIQHALLNGDKITGVTIFRIRKRMDAGEILGQVEEPVSAEDNYLILHDRLAEKAAPLLLGVLDRIENGTIEPVLQDESGVVLAPKVAKEDGAIDWTRSAEEIEHQIQALTPWPGAYSFYPRGSKKIRLIVTRGSALEGHGEPGRIVDARKRILVGCGSGLLNIVRLKREGKTEMAADAFLRGLQIEEGAFLMSES